MGSEKLCYGYSYAVTSLHTLVYYSVLQCRVRVTLQYNTTAAPSQCAGYVFRGTQVIDIYTVHDVHENMIIIALCGLQKVVFY